jgi:hypothetical protein
MLDNFAADKEFVNWLLKQVPHDDRTASQR